MSPGWAGNLVSLSGRVAAAVALVWTISVFTGCSSYRKTLDDSYAQAKVGNFDQAIANLDGSRLGRSKTNRLLFLMEKGLLLHLQGNYRKSNAVFEEADLLAEDLFTRSLSAESLSFITNDNLIPYAGEDYELVYLNYYKALNYLALGELDEARVEARRIDEKLNWFKDRYEGKNIFSEDAFLRFLSGLIYEAQGDWNNAFIAYRKSLEAYRSCKARYGVEVPNALWGRILVCARRTGLVEEHYRFLEEAREAGLEPEEESPVIAIIIDNGFIPVKREVFALVPTENGVPVKLAVPDFESRSGKRKPVAISVDCRAWISAEPVENLEAVARQSLEDKKLRVIAKLASRALVKQALVVKAEKEYGQLVGITAQLAALLTEQTDLRSWSSLPAEILLAMEPVEPGRHSVTIRLGDRVETRVVDVGEGSIGFVVARGF